MKNFISLIFIIVIILLFIKNSTSQDINNRVIIFKEGCLSSLRLNETVYKIQYFTDSMEIVRVKKNSYSGRKEEEIKHVTRKDKKFKDILGVFYLDTSFTLKKPTSKVVKDGDTIIARTQLSHYCYKKIKILYEEENKFKKTIPKYFFDKNYMSDEKLKYNSSLKSIKKINKLDSILNLLYR